MYGFYFSPAFNLSLRNELAHRLGYVFLMMPFHAFLAVTLMNTSALLGPGAGRAIMWGGGELVAVVAVIGVMMSWAKQGEKEARRVDRRLRRADGCGHAAGGGSHPPGARGRWRRQRARPGT